MARKRTSADDEWDDSDRPDEEWSGGSHASDDAESELEEDDHDTLDRERFKSETAFCPECGAEIYDAADVCPKCFTWIDGETQRRPFSRRSQTMRQTVVWLLIATLLAGAGVLSFLQLL